MHYTKSYELRNIKNTPDGCYQIQFVRDGKSHSSFSKNLKEAKKIRNEMEKKIGIVNQKFNEKPLSYKDSMIPETKNPMPAGISLNYSEKNKQFHITVNWFRIDRKPRSKHFYAGTENTYYEGKGVEAYARAIEFRRAWESAINLNELEKFDPIEFNL